MKFENQNSGDFMANSETKTIELGPCGGNGGTSFDDGSQSKVKQISIRYGNCIDSLQVSYANKTGELFTPKKHGWDGGSKKVMKLEQDENIIGISGWVGSHGNYTVIRSLRFRTNKRTYGPYGNEEGRFFNLPTESGFVVGFFGRSGQFLDAIGVRVGFIQSPRPVLNGVPVNNVVIENANVFIN